MPTPKVRAASILGIPLSLRLRRSSCAGPLSKRSSPDDAGQPSCVARGSSSRCSVCTNTGRFKPAGVLGNVKNLKKPEIGENARAGTTNRTPEQMQGTIAAMCGRFVRGRIRHAPPLHGLYRVGDAQLQLVDLPQARPLYLAHESLGKLRHYRRVEGCVLYLLACEGRSAPLRLLFVLGELALELALDNRL